MANPTMTLIASNTVGSGGVSSVTFSSIPATWTDLVLKLSMRGNYTGDLVTNPAITFNGTSTGYSEKLLWNSNNNTAGSASNSGSGFLFTWANGPSSTSNTFSNSEIYIPNYTLSNYKSMSSDSVNENNSSSNGLLSLDAGLWSNTAAITSITLTPLYGSFVQYSTFYLYGISNS
jgi:hypothetical protein